jgi:hypothetical protein
MFHPTAALLLVVVALFAAMLVFLEIGRRTGARHRIEGLGSLEGAVFGIMGLLMAFTFGNAAVRFEARRRMTVDEANHISTAYLRLDLLPAAAQPALRDLFREYVDTRIEISELLPDLEAAKSHLANMAVLQRRIWDASVVAVLELNSPAVTTLVLSELNDMIDITTTRTVAVQTHQSPVIFFMLAVVMLASALLAGFGMGAGAKRSRIHIACFAFVLAIAFYAILDLEYPRAGFVRLDWADYLLGEVRKGMG